MNSKLCVRIKACSAADVESATKDNITLKPGKSFIVVIAILPTTFSIKSYDTTSGLRSDFEMSVYLKNSEADLLKRTRRSLLLLLSLSDGGTIVIGSVDFPVKATFAKDVNVTTVGFAQSQPG